MKRFLLIVSLFFVSGTSLFAQDDDNDGNEKIRDRMNEYIQKRLNLSNDEAKKIQSDLFTIFQRVASNAT